ncbi:hypothetical protein SS53G_0003 [Shigella sonnei 53G]|nr:hypothetical protein SS53G_0003 [Shigella sonnei 53G]
MPFYFRKECPLNSGYLIQWVNLFIGAHCFLTSTQIKITASDE